MQNAARAMQEQEVEASKAKVRTEEEWELPKELWGGEATTSEDQLVSYEPSYLPFLFPGFAGGTSSVKAAMAVDGIIRTDGLTGQYQCRRKMSKQIAEELGQEDEDVQRLASEKKKKNQGILPRGARGISRAAAPSTKPNISPAPTKPLTPEGFLKPHVESPHSKKRQASQSDHQPKRKRTEETVL